ncbi:unnamed protein product [Rhizoctonia solani]|uniref:Nephrocystin 3-like N-terminal domain-containing protein n=1 Tax=Rhizoctonia solani TaxID=456999 RepID=A0A8H3CYV4_9AGAM|nr:unnamed protein product [Rhizoctonia solani]
MSFRKKLFGSKSRIQAGTNDATQGNEAPIAPGSPGRLASPTVERTSPRLSPTPASSTQAKWRKLSWANLKGLLDTLNQAASASGLGPLKTVVQGLIECIEIFEDAAQGQQAYIELQAELEETFKRLQQYLALSPTIVASVSHVCVLIQKEIEDLKSQQTRPRKRRLSGGMDDETNVLASYKRMRTQLQHLPLDISISTLAIIEQHAMDARLEKLAPAISARYNLENKNIPRRGPCTEGTRTKVLDAMYQWAICKDTGNIYWMSGMAGTGKTTIAYTLCKRLDVGSNRNLGASFFCSRSLPECRSVGRIIPSIAYQLAQRFQPYQHVLCEAIKNNPDAQDGGPGVQFESLIVGPLSDPKVKEAFPLNVVVVIDALDECEDATSTRQILDTLSIKLKGLPIKFVVSSRPEAAIRDLMEKNGSWVSSRVVLHELDSGEVQTDIKTYLEAELTPISPSLVEIEKLVERAGVLFIYAATVVRYVGHDNFRRQPRQRLKMVLETTKKQGGAQTKAIDELYGAILEAAVNDDQLELEDIDDMKLILNTVICAKAPLTVDALNGLLNLGEVDRVDAALRPLWSVLHIMQPNKTVTTLHASFPDYLTDPKRSSSDWHCDPAAHNRVLAERCFEYIRHTKPQFNICRLPSSFLYDHEVEDMDSRVQEFISSELRYACQYWSAHLDGSDAADASTLMTLLDYFLTTNLLLWVEVMNLTKNISATPANLSIAKRWAMVSKILFGHSQLTLQLIKPHSPSRGLVDLIHDAMRFTNSVISSPVSQSTPHIYISMLPFLSSHSPIRKHYMPGMQLAGVRGPALDRRKPLLAKWPVRRSGSVACSPDGTLLAIGPWDKKDPISLVQTSSGRSVRDISQEHASHVRCIALSPDGTCIACGTKKGTIWVWDVSSGHPLLGPLQGHQKSVISIIFSHDGSRIISGSDDNTIRIWESRSGECLLGPLIGHTDPVLCLAVSSDDSMLISGSADSTIRVWDMQTGCPLFNPITRHTHFVRSVAISPDGRWFVSGSDDGTVRVWNTRTGQTLLGPLQTQNGRPSSIAISPDGAHFSAGFGDGTIQIWDATTGQAVSSPFKEHSMGVYVCLMPRPQLLPWTCHLVTPCPSFRLTFRPTASALSPGQMIPRILSCSSDRNLYQWDAQTGAIYQVDSPIVDPFISEYQSLGFVSATYSPDGNSIAAISRRGDIYIWDSSSDEINLGPIRTEKGGMAIEFSLDGKSLLTGWRDRAVHIWDVQTGQLVSSHQPQDYLIVSSFAFSPDLHRNIIADWNFGAASLHQRGTHTGERITGLFEGHTDYITTVQYSSDGRHIVSGSHDKTVRIWDAQTGDSVFGPLRGHTDYVHSVAYSPDRTYVASASDDTTIRIWDTGLINHDSEAYETPGVVEWVLDEDGWVVDEQSQRLIWVPPDLRSSLMSPRNAMLISQNGYVRLDFGGAPIGKEWARCWSGC